LDWDDNAHDYGIPVNGTPAVGAIAQWNGGAGGTGDLGHVAYVEQVGPDFIVTSDDNFNLRNGGSTSRQKITRASGGWPSNFIHLKDVRHAHPDFNGDGKADIAWYEAWQNAITILRSTDKGLVVAGKRGGLGAPTWAGVGDFNGDGKADIAWYEAWQNAITILRSTDKGLVAAGKRGGLGAPTWAGVG
jgi:surface antigen